MCIFTRPVDHVSATSILARPLGSRQLLVYQMNLEASEPLAMVVPVPTPPGAGDGAVEMVDLSGYPSFFTDLRASIHEYTFGPGLCAHPQARAPLPVHRVGSFVASFAPAAADLDRLDPRFRLAPEVAAALPDLGGGYVVFQLAGDGPRTVHPMAFWFERRDRRALYFPTVHVHDLTVPDTAEFDHQLYFQGEVDDDEWDHHLDAIDVPWGYHSVETVDAARTPFPWLDWVGYQELRGRRPNRDVWVRLP